MFYISNSITGGDNEISLIQINLEGGGEQPLGIQFEGGGGSEGIENEA
jgi:hypothetical protein